MDKRTFLKTGEYILPPLGYAYDALEPYIDKQTLILHHDTHHAGYVRG
jgi:Fe-Mn family superoxide dismutase